ncbi:sarcosine oxidase subunit gamma [Nesterenkonia sp. K-15-9-6]|uniref:sarcosine oxidase subunit gamma n=1 Tax=Nesterenkonia sp. K-15-9-6 TaxID=3093918 RepID=UPI0040442700
MGDHTVTMTAETARTGPHQGGPQGPRRRSPVAHLEEAMHDAGVSGRREVRLREIAFPVQLGVRVRPGTPSAQAVEQRVGLTLPQHHRGTSGDLNGLHAVWLGPDEFLVIDVSREQLPGEAEELAGCLEGLPGQLLDLSANRAVLELAGVEARAVLEKGCAVDLHPRAFPVGSGVSTLLGTVPVVLVRSAETTWRILPRASFADYTVRWLIDAMAEFAQPELPGAPGFL